MQTGSNRHPRREQARTRQKSSPNSKPKTSRVTQIFGIAVLSTVIAVAPWFFGSYRPAVYQWLLLGILLGCGSWVVDLVSSRRREDGLPLATIVLVLALVWGFFQLLPIPVGTLSVIAPGATHVREKLLSTFEKMDADLEWVAPSTGQISLNPWATRKDLALLIGGVAAFLLAAALFRTRVSQQTLAWVLTINGAALAFFGLVQKLTWNGHLYWTFPLRFGGGPFGPFVNRNNAAGFINLCLAGAIGLIIWSLREDENGETLSEEQPGKDLKQGVMRFIAGLNAITLSAIALAGLMIGGVIGSGSRGGMISLAAGLGLALVILAVTRSKLPRVWALALAVAAGVGFLAWVGMEGIIHERMSTLVEDNVQGGRLPHWEDSLKAFPDFWSVGSGLGTYRVIYRRYQTRVAEVLFDHAENHYLEALIEAGVPGLLLVLGAIVLVVQSGLTVMRYDSEEGRAFAFGWLFAVGAQCTHALFDFGLYMPANLLLFATIAGVLCGRACVLQLDIQQEKFVRIPKLVRPPQIAVVALGTVLLCGWAWSNARGLVIHDRALDATREVAFEPDTSPRDLQRAITQLEAALRANWDDAQCHLQLARTLVHGYQQEELARLQKQYPKASLSQLWQGATLMTLYRNACNLSRSNELEKLQELRELPHVVQYLTPAYRHLQAACMVCPTMPVVHSMLGQLCFLAGTPENNHSATAIRDLAQGDAGLLFTAGLLDYYQGRMNAFTAFRESLISGDDHEAEILKLCEPRLVFSQVIELVLPLDPAYLVSLARKRYADPKRKEEKTLLLTQARALLASDKNADGNAHKVLGEILAMEGNWAEAAKEYEEAIRVEPNKPEWRYELARVLWAGKQQQAAHEQIKVCVRMQPRNRLYAEFLLEIERTLLRQ